MTTLSGYRGISTVLSTELNSLVATNGKVLSAAVDNTTNLDLFDDLELVVTFGTAPFLGGVVEVYLLASVDGTNYPDGSSTVTPQSSLFVGGFAVQSVTTAQRLVLRGIPLPPGLFKYLVQNTANQAFAASGNTLRRNPFFLETG